MSKGILETQGWDRGARLPLEWLDSLQGDETPKVAVKTPKNKNGKES